MDEKNRRSSILKRAFVEDASPTYTFNKISRRISFSGKNNVKEFLPADNGGTIWGTSYEEETDENVKIEPKIAVKSQPLKIRENPSSVESSKNLTSNVSYNAFAVPNSDSSNDNANKFKIVSPKRNKRFTIQSKVDFEKTLDISLSENELRHIQYKQCLRDSEAGNRSSESPISLDNTKNKLYSTFSLFDKEREYLKSGKHTNFSLSDLIILGNNFSLSPTKNAGNGSNHNVEGLEPSTFKSDSKVNIPQNTKKCENFGVDNDENNKENIFFVNLNIENAMNISKSPEQSRVDYESVPAHKLNSERKEMKFVLSNETMLDQNTIGNDTLQVKRLTTHDVQDLRLCDTRNTEQEKVIVESSKRRTVYDEDDMDLTPINEQVLSIDDCAAKDVSMLETDGQRNNNITYSNNTYNITYNPSDLNFLSVNDDTDKLININMNREEAVQKMSVYKSSGPMQTSSDDLDLTLQEDKPLNVENVPSYFLSVPNLSLKEVDLSTAHCFNVEKIVKPSRKTMYHDSPIEDIESTNPSVSLQPGNTLAENNFKTKRQTTFYPIDLDLCEPTGSVDTNRVLGDSEKNRRTTMNIESELDISDGVDSHVLMDLDDVEAASSSVLLENQSTFIGKSLVENNTTKRCEQSKKAPEILKKIQSFKEAKPIICSTVNEDCTNVDLNLTTIPSARGLQTENEPCFNISIDFFGKTSTFKSNDLKSGPNYSEVVKKNLNENKPLGCNKEAFGKQCQNPVDGVKHDKENYSRGMSNKPRNWHFSLNIDEEDSLQMQFRASKKNNDFPPLEAINNNSETDDLDNVHGKETPKICSSSRDANASNLKPKIASTSASKQQLHNQIETSINKVNYKMDSSSKDERIKDLTNENVKHKNHSANIINQTQNMKSKKVLFEEINDPLSLTKTNYKLMDESIMKNDRLKILKQVDVDTSLDYSSLNHPGSAKCQKSSLNNMDMSWLNESNATLTNKENVNSYVLENKLQVQYGLNEQTTSRKKRETQYEGNLDLEPTSRINPKHFQTAHSEDMEFANCELENDDRLVVTNSLGTQKPNKRRFTVYDEDDMAFEEPTMDPPNVIVAKSEKLCKAAHESVTNYEKDKNFEYEEVSQAMYRKKNRATTYKVVDLEIDPGNEGLRSQEIDKNVNLKQINNQKRGTIFLNDERIVELNKTEDILTPGPVTSRDKDKILEYEEWSKRMHSKKNRATTYKVVDLEIEQENEGLRSAEIDGDANLNQVNNQKRGTVFLNEEQIGELNITKNITTGTINEIDKNFEYGEWSKRMYSKKNRMTTHKVVDLEIDEESNLNQVNNQKRGTIFLNEEQIEELNKTENIATPEPVRSNRKDKNVEGEEWSKRLYSKKNRATTYRVVDLEIDQENNLNQVDNQRRVNKEQDESCIFVENSFQVENNRCHINKISLNICDEKHSSEDDVKTDTSISTIRSADADLSFNVPDSTIASPLAEIGKNGLMEGANSEASTADFNNIKNVSVVDEYYAKQCSTNKIDTKDIPEKLNNEITELKQNTISYKNNEFPKSGSNCRNNSDDDLNLITIDLINDSIEMSTTSAVDENILEPKKLESTTDLKDFNKFKNFTKNIEKNSLKDLQNSSLKNSSDDEDTLPRVPPSQAFSLKQNSIFNATEIDLSPISSSSYDATLFLKSMSKAGNNRLTIVRPEETQNTICSDSSFKEDKSKYFDGATTARNSNIRPANVEIHFPTSCGRDSIREALDAYKKRRESQNFDTKCEESLLLPEVPSVGFLLENYLKNESKVESEDEVGAFLPITPKFEYLLHNKIQCENLNWDFNTIYIRIGFMEIFHKHVSSVQFQLHFSPKYIYSNKDQIVFEKVLLKTEKNIANLSSVNTLIQREIQKRIPYEFSKLCSTSNDLFSFLNDMDTIFSDAIRSVKEFVKLIKHNWCSLKKDSSGELCIKKIVDRRRDGTNLVSSQVFMVRVRTIDKISYTDIIFPPKSDLLESIQSLPEGIEFVSSFFGDPNKFLKC